MKNALRASIALVLVAVVLGACGSAKPEPTPAPKTTPAPVAASRYTIIDWKNQEFGITADKIPKWVVSDISDTEADAKYKDKYCFVIEGTGADLEGTRLAANQLNGASEVARFVSLRVQALFSGAQAGDTKGVSTYMENIVKSLADAKISGLRKEDEFWVLKEYKDPKKQEYNYRVLLTVDRATIKKLLGDAADAQKAATPEEVTAKDRVKKIVDGSLPALSGN